MWSRLIAMLLLAMLLFGSAGYYIVFKAEQVAIRTIIRKELKQSVPRDQLREIILSPDEQAQLQWEEDGKEFWYKGSMYDIVHISKEKGKVRYYCISDRDETRLFARLGKLVKEQQNEQQNSPAKYFAKIFFSLAYYLPERCSLPFRPVAYLAHVEWPQQLGTQEYYTLHAPPPKPGLV